MMCTEKTGVQAEIDKLSSIVNVIIVYDKLSNGNESKTTNFEKIDMMIAEADNAFQNVETSVKQEAMYWYLLGKMYLCSPNHPLKAIEVLKKATAIDPGFVDAWNELGECYWGMLEADLARQCFERALKKSVNKVSLRNLSVVTRYQSLRMEPNEKTKGLDNALNLAKRAVELDIKDGDSWTVLGNSYLAVFFNSALQRKYILQAIACFNQAERNLDERYRASVYFNKAVTYKYLENYACALDYLKRCSAHGFPIETYDSLIQYLEKIKISIGNKGKLQDKRYNVMLKDIKSKAKLYSVTPGYAICNIKDLKDGANEGYFLLGKVLWTIDGAPSFPATFGLVDARGDEIVVTVFSLNPCLNVFKIGDMIRIYDPQYEIVNLTHEQNEYKFKKIRIDNPTTIVINNKFLPQEFYITYFFETSPN